jgi:hypothetical protein
MAAGCELPLRASRVEYAIKHRLLSLKIAEVEKVIYTSIMLEEKQDDLAVF